MNSPNFDQFGLITVVVQDVHSRDVLMVAMMDKQAYVLTLETGQAHFWSRSRKRLWLKGETSGNRLDVRKMSLDCDSDALLLLVEARGPACHTNATSCFFNSVEI